jgi:hypothetical protein
MRSIGFFLPHHRIPHKQYSWNTETTMKFVGISLVAIATTSTVGAFMLKPSVVQQRSNHVGSKGAEVSVLNMADEINGFATAASKDSDLLGLPSRPGRPLKIAIAGGGVGGLTAALCMLKKGFDVTVYEKTSAFARFGGPIQFASNALSVLKEIDDQLFDRVMDKFTFTGTRTCGIKDGRYYDFGMLNSSFSPRFQELTFLYLLIQVCGRMDPSE